MISVGGIKIDNTDSGYKEGDLEISIKSNEGKKDSDNEGITLVAPGELIPVYNLQQNKTFATGTSFATPYVAAVLALYLSSAQDDGKITQKTAHEMLINTTYKVVQKHIEKIWGNGVIDPIKLILKQP